MGSHEAYRNSLESAPRRPLRGGRGESVRLVDEEVGSAANVDLHLNYLYPGSGPGPRHYHERAENVYLVLDGTIEVEVGNEVVSLAADEVLMIPPGVVHATSNPGDRTAVFLEIYAPAGADFHVVPEPD
jgi:mannose-6-phosphate isomerase-like protein (cupin superfamily)